MSHLEKERKTTSFDVQKLSELFYTLGGKSQLKEFLEFQKVIAEDPILKYDASEIGIGRKETMTRMARKTARLHELFGMCSFAYVDYHHILPGQVIGTVHNVMFVPTIKYLGTDKQIEKYLDDAHSLKIFGCYAQTELGHGSDVQSLETTATYDPATEEFTIHSPTISSTKWWPGELGVFATHCVTHAQLIVMGVNYGVQTFIVQIRDVETHQPLKGITVGDIGPKLGYTTKDNGFLRFDNVKIPRENMLMRYAKISKSGEFSKAANEKIAYATMLMVRMGLLEEAYKFLSSAGTIALRYSAFRKQFRDEEGQERVILDYQLQLNKLVPILANTYAMNATYKKLYNGYHDMMKRINEKQDFSTMNEFHSILAGCKSFWTWDALNGIEVCRQACGGHGYSSYSGIPLLFDGYGPAVTFEGDNTVMALQTARYLLKVAQHVASGQKVQGVLGYLKTATSQRCSAKNKDEVSTLEAIEKALQASSAQLIWKVSQKFQTLIGEGHSMKQVWDKKAGIDLFEASRAFINCFTFSGFAQMIREDIKDQKVAAVMSKLCALYGIEKILQHPLGVVESEYFLPVHFVYLKAKKEDLLEELRNDAIGLTDAFAFRDESLCSALAVSDGKVYETLYDWAVNKNDVNQGNRSEGYFKYIKPVMGKYSHVKPKL